MSFTSRPLKAGDGGGKKSNKHSNKHKKSWSNLFGNRNRTKSQNIKYTHVYHMNKKKVHQYFMN